LLLILGSGAITTAVVFGLRGPKNLLALAISRLPFELALRIYTLRGLPTGPEGEFGVVNSAPLSTGVVVAASVGLTVVAAAVTWWRVVGTEVTK
jgi:hypothetical protein